MNRTTIAGLAFGLALGGLLIILINSSQTADIARGKLYDTCFKRLLTETTYDANMLKERSKFLEECMSNY